MTARYRGVCSPAGRGGARFAPRLLVTAGGSGMSANLVRSLRAGLPGATILACHSDAFLLARAAGDSRHLLSPRGNGGWAAALAALAGGERVDLVIPITDDETLLASRARRRLRGRLALPSHRAILACQDKLVLQRLLDAAGVAVPQTRAAGSRGAVERVFRRQRWALAWCRTRRGSASRAATMVRDAGQAWAWIEYWATMRATPAASFTLSEFLPGRDFNVQGIWQQGRPVMLAMCERLRYLGGAERPSGMSSTPALARLLHDGRVLETARAAVHAVAPRGSGVFNVDLKEDARGTPRVTEINAGRFAMITNLYDLGGSRNMAAAFVRMALGEDPPRGPVADRDAAAYLVRDPDTEPTVLPGKAMLDALDAASDDVFTS